MADAGSTPNRLHNQPPEEGDEFAALRLQLEQHHQATAALLARMEDIYSRVPAEITDATVNGKAADFVKMLQTAIKDTDALRVAEKAPYERRAQVVHGFFVAKTERLEKIKTDVERRQTVYLRAVEAEERRQRQ
jgi:hypothetical protein